MKFKDTKYGDLTGQYYDGDIELSKVGLSSLDGSPTKVIGGYDKVIGGFNCSHNNLTSLKGAPVYISGSFRCFNNQLTSLKGAPETVDEAFFCYDNKLTTLEGCPKVVGGIFACHRNKLTSLKGAPKSVGKYFACTGNNIVNVKQEIIENQVKAKEYHTDDGDFKFEDIEKEFNEYGMLNKKVKSNGFRSLLGLKK